MRKLLLILGFITVLHLSLYTHPSSTQACSCLPPGSVAEERDNSNAVFQGTVESIQSSSTTKNTVIFQVDKYWKGNVGKTITVQTEENSASCGYPFQEGKKYLVYTRNTIDLRNFSTGLCSRTNLLTKAEKDLSSLGQAQIPLDPQQEVNKIADQQLSWIEKILEWIKDLFR